MRADDVRDCLALKWPDDQYLSVPEAPEDPARQGRKIDVLVVSLWRSRGLERDAVEIKVDASDWAREKDRAEKADVWWRHSHRFWVAVPERLVERVQPELPTTWGLLSCTPGEKPKVVVRPESREAEPLPWPTVVGVLRASADAGLGALRRARDDGFEDGRKLGQQEMKRRTGEAHMQRRVQELEQKIADFREASGIDLDREYDAERVGQLAAIALNELDFGSRRALTDVESVAEELEAHAAGAKKKAKRIRDAAKGLQELAANGTAQDPHTTGEDHG